jgi:hypothetical protein
MIANHRRALEARVLQFAMVPSRRQDTVHDVLCASRHFQRRATRECKKQDAIGIRTLKDKMRDAMRERIGLTGSGAGNDQKRTAPKLCGFELPVVEAAEWSDVFHNGEL